MKLKILSLIIIVLAFLSCTNDDESTSILAPVSLTFKLETAEDQMGEFSSNAMVVFNDKVWSVAGYNNGVSHPFANNEVWKSDNGINWVSVTSDIFEPRTNHTLTVFDDKMWLIGGANNSSFRLSDVWYSNDGLIWSLATDTPSFGVAFGHSTVVFNDRLYLINDRDVWSSTDGINWNLEADNIFSSRFFKSAVVFNDAIYVIGGSGSTVTGFAIYNEIWKSIDGINWALVSSIAPVFTPRMRHTATVYNDKVWVIGGDTASGFDSDEIWVSSDMITWQNYTGTIPFGARKDHVNLVFNDVLWLFGGIGSDDSSIWTIKEE